MSESSLAPLRLRGLVAAPHTPFHSYGSLRLEIVEKQAMHLLQNGVQTVFIGGTTGESHSLSLTERQALTQRWCEVARGTALQVVAHVGSNCLADACALAAQAQQAGAIALSALAPSYFKPRSLEALIACCAEIAAAAPAMPFYYYDIPVLTGVSFPMVEFLEQAPARIPTLRGLKFTNPDLMTYLQCLQAADGRWDVTWGIDEWLLAALAVGARGAVGSSYNFAAPLYQGLMAAFERGDWESARRAQYRSTQLIALLARYGYLGAAKATMSMLGVEVGPARLPNGSLPAEQVRQLRSELETLGFFDWIRP